MNKRRVILQVICIGTINLLTFLGLGLWNTSLDILKLTVAAGVFYLAPTVIIFLWNNSTYKLLEELSQALKQFNNGNFTADIKVNTRSKELLEIIMQYKVLREMLNTWIYELLHCAVAVKSSAERINGDSERTSEGMQELNMSLNEINESFSETSEMLKQISSASMQLSQSGSKIAGRCMDTVERIRETNDAAREGGKALVQATAAMKAMQLQMTASYQKLTHLDQVSQEIGAITKLISRISHQTNMLALNASIESARAGELGRGFGIIAHQIRKLSEETKGAANKINELIETIQQEVMITVSSMESANHKVIEGTKVIAGTNEKLEQIILTTKAALNDIENITEDAKEQSQKTDMISDSAVTVNEKSRTGTASVQEISCVMENQSDNIEKTKEATRKLLDISLNLEKVMNRFDETLGEQMLKVCAQIAALLSEKKMQNTELTGKDLSDLSGKYGLSEIHIVNEQGIIEKSNNTEILGFQFSDKKGTQTYDFLQILRNPSLRVNQKAAFRDVDGRLFKYAGVSMLNQSGIVQCGLDASKLTEFTSVI